MDIALEILSTVVVLGCLYALATVGFTLIYSVTKILHVAQGGVVLTAAYIFLWLVNNNIPIIVSILATLAISAIFGWLANFFVYERLQTKGKASIAGSLIASIAILFVLQNMLLMTFGARIKSIRTVSLFTNIDIFGAVISFFDIIIVLVTIFILALLTLFLKKTRLGVSLRAVSDNATVSEIIGIHAKNMRSMSFIIGSLLAGITGILFVIKFSVEPNMGLQIAIAAFARAIVGGVGSIGGAVAGSFLIELAENVGGWFFNAAYKTIFSFLMVFVFLLFRPQGIFGNKKN